MILILVLMQIKITQRSIRSEELMASVGIVPRLRVLLLSWTSIHLPAILRQISSATMCTDRFGGSMLNGICLISFGPIQAGSKESVH